MDIYPQSTLRDIYKNFFQDRFGPFGCVTKYRQSRTFSIFIYDGNGSVTELANFRMGRDS